MKGQALLVCRDCGRTASVTGEIPDDYSACFIEVVQRDGWVVAPSNKVDLLCGACLRTYEGSETHDAAEKIRPAGFSPRAR
jgi:hypothetical protein